MEKSDAIRILSELWKFYLCKELKLDLENDQNIAIKIIQLKNDRSHPLTSSLISARYLEQTGLGYGDWRRSGYTAISFVISKIFPGKRWCKKHAIEPSMFFQTRSKCIEMEEIISLMGIIWLRHICKIDSEDNAEQIKDAKRTFLARHMDKDFFDRKLWQEYGLSSSLQKGGIKKLEKCLAKKFAKDIGIKYFPGEQWSAERFKRDNPDVSFLECIYKKSKPVDLHHLLERSNFPEYLYHRENVVPISPQLHAYITRKKWTEEIKTEYLRAQQKWIDAPSGQKVGVFDEVMQKIKIGTQNKP